MKCRTYPRAMACVLLLAASGALLCLCGCKELSREGISFLAWSPDGRMLASIYDRVVYVGSPDGTVPLRSFEDLQIAENELSWSPDAGALAYTSVASGSWDIWILDTKKGRSARITTHLAKDYRPCWLPTGKAILFLSYRSLQPDLWRFDILEKTVTRLTSDALEENTLTLSRDGSRLAFKATDSEGASDLVVLDLKTGERLKLLTRRADLGAAALSPDGKQICFVLGKTLRVVHVGGLLGGRGKVIVKATEKDITYCAWAPDGRSVLFLRDGRTQTKSFELFGTVRPLAPSLGRERFARWSPDGSLVAYATTGQSGRPLVAVVNVKTGKRDWLAQSMADCVEAANYAAATGRWDECTKVIESGLSTFPPDEYSADAVEKITEAYLHLGEYDKLLAIHEKRTRDHTAIGIVYLFCFQDFARAREEFEQAHKKDPEAQRFLKLLREEKPDLLKLYCRAELAERRGKFAEAARESEAYLQAAPDSKTAETVAYNLGHLYSEKLGKPEKALHAYARAIARFPSSPRVEEATLARARLFRKLDRFREATIEYDSARHTEEPEIRLEALRAIAEMKETRGDYADAISYYRLAARSVPPVDPESLHAEEKGKERVESQVAFASKVIELNAKLQRSESAQRNARLLLERVWRTPEERSEAVPRMVAAFDRCGLHAAGTEFVAWARKEAGASITFSGSLDEWLKMCKYVPHRVLLECRLGHLPKWAENRLKLFADLAATARDEAGRFEATILSMVTAHRPSEVQEQLTQLRGGGGLSEQHVVILTALGNYLLGNFYQTRGETRKALDHYQEMYAAAKDEDFLGILKGYDAFLPIQRHMLQRWLDIERETANGIWKGSERLLGSAISSEAGKEKYERFIQDFSNSALVGDAYYRAAMLATGRIRERYLRRVITSYPDCDSAEQALYDLSREYSRQANWWVFAQFIEGILDNPNQKTHRVLYELWLCTIYGETLKDVPEARKHIQVLFDKFPGTEEWAMAKRLNATYLMDEKKYQEAIDDVKDIVRLRPRDPWVLRGRALQTIAQCHEHMGEWGQAELEYVAFIETYRNRPDVTTGKLLARLIPKLSEGAVKHMYERFPEDFVKAAFQVPKAELNRLYEWLPDLRKRVRAKEEEILEPAEEPRKPRD